MPNQNAVKRSQAPCACCGEENFSTGYHDCHEKRRMDRDGLCFTCAFWELKAEKDNPTVIDGALYTPGNRTHGDFRGMAGRRFDIEYFDGRRITTFDLWSGGPIPDRWKSRIPDTARFLNEAKRVQVGETTCFNQSTASAPLYPLPKDNPPKPTPCS